MKTTKGILIHKEPITTQIKKRSCYKELDNYLHNSSKKKIFTVSGVLGSGKTVLLQQAFNDSLHRGKNSVFISFQEEAECTMKELKEFVQQLISQGTEYFFIDNIEYVEDFYYCFGLVQLIQPKIHIVIAGAYSLNMVMNKLSVWYDSIILLKTSFVSFKEYHYITEGDLASFIEGKGGISSEFLKYNSDDISCVFRSIEDNIEHSVENWSYEKPFRNLYSLFGMRDTRPSVSAYLSDVFSYIREEDFDNPNFEKIITGAKQIICKKYPSADESEFEDALSYFAYKLLLRNETILQNLSDSTKKALQDALRSANIIAKLYSELDPEPVPIVLQYGAAYSYTKQIIRSIIKDIESEKTLNKDTSEILEQVLTEKLRNRLLSEIILLESDHSGHKSGRKTERPPTKYGDIDMLIRLNNGCEVYKICCDDEVCDRQYKGLLDNDIADNIENEYGAICKKAVIYMGEPAKLKINNREIEYINAQQYLLSL